MKPSKLFKINTPVFIIFGLCAIFLPIIIKTKSIGSLISPIALFIVIGGVFCATCVAFSLKRIIRAFCSLKNLFSKREEAELNTMAQELVEMAKVARSRGVEELADYIPNVKNSFIKLALPYLLSQPDITRLEDELRFLNYLCNKEDYENSEIFEEMGGYAPTFGMLGAIAGLIQITSMNTDPNALLSGIATAFVATLYGVASANLIFLPLAKKIRNNIDKSIITGEIALTLLLDIAQGQSSVVISEKLDRFFEMNNISRKGKVLKFAA